MAVGEVPGRLKASGRMQAFGSAIGDCLVQGERANAQQKDAADNCKNHSFGYAKLRAF